MTKHPFFQLCRYQGRDPEFTIAGSEEAFEELADRIKDHLKARRETKSQWGNLIVTCTAEEFGIPNSKTALYFMIGQNTWPGKKSWRPAFGHSWSLVLGLTGFIAIIYFIIRALTYLLQ